MTRREVRLGGSPDARLPEIYLFVNSGKGTEWQSGSGLSEDGEFLSGHCSSSEHWARHDLGLTSDWKHELYRERYPDGFALVWVDEPKGHAGIDAAYDKHCAAGDGGTPWQRERKASP